MAITKTDDKINKTVQEMENLSFDTTYNVLARESLGHDGVSMQRKNADNMAVKIATSGTDTYVGFAAPGTALATEKWQAMKIDTDGNVSWADGNSDFDNAATDLTSLDYS